MKTMRFAILLIAVFMSNRLMASPSEAFQKAESQVLSTEQIKNQTLGFKDWKQKRVFTARAELDAFKAPKKLGGSLQAEKEQSSVENSGDKHDLNSNNVQESENKSATLASTQTPVNTSLEGVENKESQTQMPNENLGNKIQEEKLRQLEFNLEIAQGLTIHDYFALYLKDKSRQEMALAIQQLSPDEVSDLLLAYRQSLYGVPKSAKADKSQLNQNL